MRAETELNNTMNVFGDNGIIEIETIQNADAIKPYSKVAIRIDSIEAYGHFLNNDKYFALFYATQLGYSSAITKDSFDRITELCRSSDWIKIEDPKRYKIFMNPQRISSISDRIVINKDIKEKKCFVNFCNGASLIIPESRKWMMSRLNF